MIPETASADGLTAAELFARLRVRGLVRGGEEHAVLSWLREDERRGLVERVDRHWRLTTEAEAEFGEALSCLSSDGWSANP
jgi:hypothetical protein